MSTNLAYHGNRDDTSAPVYLREGEDMNELDSREGLKTVTRLTALGSRAGTLQNYSTEGHTILYPTPSDDA